jgi:hypothetical protein
VTLPNPTAVCNSAFDSTDAATCSIRSFDAHPHTFGKITSTALIVHPRRPHAALLRIQRRGRPHLQIRFQTGTQRSWALRSFLRFAVRCEPRGVHEEPGIPQDGRHSPCSTPRHPLRHGAKALRTLHTPSSPCAGKSFSSPKDTVLPRRASGIFQRSDGLAQSAMECVDHRRRNSSPVPVARVSALLLWSTNGGCVSWEHATLIPTQSLVAGAFRGTRLPPVPSPGR